MKKQLLLLALIVSGIIALIGCGKDCEPSGLPQDDIVYLNIVRPTGRSYIKYTGNALPADSLRITNLANGSAVSRFLIRDSILSIDTYDKANNAITNYKIEIGAPGVRKPDTLQITVSRRAEQDDCGRDFEVSRFATLKMNNVTVICSSCAYNTVNNFIKP
jgi:hypothetical protein